MAAINEEIKKIKDQIEVLRTKIDGANEARRGQGVRSFFFLGLLRILRLLRICSTGLLSLLFYLFSVVGCLTRFTAVSGSRYMALQRSDLYSIRSVEK